MASIRSSTVFSVFLLSIASGCAEAQEGSDVPVVNAAQPMGSDLDATSFKTELEKGQALLLDVRTPTEYASGHIPGSVNLDWTAAEYETQFATLDPKTPILLYCHSGGRSEQAREYLEGRGYSAKHLTTGFVGWKRAGYPVEK